MLMLKSTHDAVVAAKDEMIAGLMRRLDAARERANQNCTGEVAARLLAADRAKEIRRLEARLAVFTAPRLRGEGGRFVSSKGRAA